MAHYSDFDNRLSTYLQVRGVTADAAEARGYEWLEAESPDSTGTVRPSGFSKSARGVLFPLQSVMGIHGYQLRRDSDAPPKFITPKDQPNMLVVHPWFIDSLQAGRDYSANDGEGEGKGIFIVEGVTRVDALAGLGIAAVGLLGIDSWKGKNKREGGATTALPDFDVLPIKGAPIIIVPDGDAWEKEGVARAVRRLGAFLQARGALTVQVLRVPNEMGLDDWIAQKLAFSHSVEDIKEGISKMRKDLSEVPDDLGMRRRILASLPEPSEQDLVEQLEPHIVKLSNPSYAGSGTRDHLAEMYMDVYGEDVILVNHTITKSNYTSVDVRPYGLDDIGVWEPYSQTMHARLQRIAECGTDAALLRFIHGLTPGHDSPSPKQIAAEASRMRSVRRLADTESGRELIMNEFKFYSRISKTVSDRELNASMDVLGCANAVVTISDGVALTREQAAAHLITTRIPTRYDDEATNNEWVAMMKSSFSADAWGYLMELIGANLTGTPGEYFIIIVGPPNSGKSTLFSALQGVFGNKALMMSPAALRARASDSSAHTSQIRPLVHSLYALVEESGGLNLVWKENDEASLLKQATSGPNTRIDFSEKNAPHESLIATALLVFVGNNFPGVGSRTDEAAKKRLRPFQVEQHGESNIGLRMAFAGSNGAAHQALLYEIVKAANRVRSDSRTAARVHDASKAPQFVQTAITAMQYSEKSAFLKWANEATEPVNPDEGDKGIFANHLWAEWCLNCDVDIPETDALSGSQKLPDKVDGAERTTAMKQFREEYALGKQVVVHMGTQTAKGWKGRRLKVQTTPEMPPCSAQWVDEKNDQGTSYKRCPQHDVTWPPEKYPHGRPTCQKKGQAQ